MNRKISIKKNEKGQGLVEYVLTAILAALVGAGVWMAFGTEIKAMATSLTEATSGGFSVHNGEVTIPNISPTLTPIPTALPTPTDLPTPTALACTSGTAIVANTSACSNLSESNYCENYSFKRKGGLCTWY